MGRYSSSKKKCAVIAENVLYTSQSLLQVLRSYTTNGTIKATISSDGGNQACTSMV